MTAFSYGPVSYNGVTFETGLKVRCRMETVYSRSGRSVMYVKYLLEVDGIVTASDVSTPVCIDPDSSYYTGDYGNWASYTPGTIDGKMMLVRERLLREGGVLHAANVGLGFDIAILTPAPGVKEPQVGPVQTNRTPGVPPVMWRTDVMFGPKPRVLDWEPIGSNKAARVRWQVEFHLPTCIAIPQSTDPNDPTSLDDVAQMEWTHVWSLDEAGMTVRTVTGIIEVAANSIPVVDQQVFDVSRTMSNNANKYRGLCKLAFEPMDGFLRNFQFSLSADYRTLLITMVDREVESGGNPYYPGCIEMDVSYTVRNMTAMVLTQFGATLSGTIRLRQGLTRKVAYSALLLILREKLSNMDREMPLLVEDMNEDAMDLGPEDVKNSEKGMNYILSEFLLSEEVFGRGITFSVGWWFFCSFAKLLQITGHFEPLTGTKTIEVDGEQKQVTQWSWDRWKEDRGDVALEDGYGYRNIDYGNDMNPARALIVGFCDTGVAPTRGDRSPLEEVLVETEPILDPSTPAPEASWIYMRNHLDTEEDTHSATQIILQPARPPYTPPAASVDDQSFSKSERGSTAIITGAGDTQPADGQSENDPSGPTPEFAYPEEDNKIIFRRTSSTFRARMRGSALRAGRAAPIPHLFDINGAECAIVARKTRVTPMGRSNCSIWLTAWDLVFEVKGQPTGDLSQVAMFGNAMKEGIA